MLSNLLPIQVYTSPKQKLEQTFGSDKFSDLEKLIHS